LFPLGVVFRPTEHGSIYASYATAANPVGMDADIDGLSASNQALDPENFTFTSISCGVCINCNTRILLFGTENCGCNIRAIFPKAPFCLSLV
jgi:outer membrane receptor for monomeric catechols